jgi:hypothetical protein
VFDIVIRAADRVEYAAAVADKGVYSAVADVDRDIYTSVADVDRGIYASVAAALGSKLSRSSKPC